jgi:hypothetical protein
MNDIVATYFPKSPIMSLYDNVVAARMRPETARVGFRYSHEDDMDMLRQAEAGVAMKQIALSKKRTVRAVRERIALMAVKIMIQEGMTLREGCDRFNIDMVLLSRTLHMERERIRNATNVIRNACM